MAIEREHQALSWLRCDTDKETHGMVDRLWCELCRKHKHNIQGSKKFLRAWIAGSSNHKTSNILDHASNNQHRAVVTKERAAAAKAANQPITTYSPITSGLLTMDKPVKKRMKRFNIGYFCAVLLLIIPAKHWLLQWLLNIIINGSYEYLMMSKHVPTDQLQCWSDILSDHFSKITILTDTMHLQTFRKY